MAKSELELEKVHARFRAQIEEDSIVLYAIDTSDKVSSYKIEKLSVDIMDELQKTIENQSREESRRNTPKNGNRIADDQARFQYKG